MQNVGQCNAHALKSASKKSNPQLPTVHVSSGLTISAPWLALVGDRKSHALVFMSKRGVFLPSSQRAPVRGSEGTGGSASRARIFVNDLLDISAIRSVCQI